MFGWFDLVCGVLFCWFGVCVLVILCVKCMICLVITFVGFGLLGVCVFVCVCVCLGWYLCFDLLLFRLGGCFDLGFFEFGLVLVLVVVGGFVLFGLVLMFVLFLLVFYLVFCF